MVWFTYYFQIQNSYENTVENCTNATDSICDGTSNKNEVCDGVHADAITYSLVDVASDQSPDSNPLEMEHFNQNIDIGMHNAQNMDR